MRALPLLIGGYFAEVVILVNWLLVVREGRSRWLAVHMLAMAAVVIGWLSIAQYPAAAVNGAWLVVSILWYAAGRRRLSRRRQP